MAFQGLKTTERIKLLVQVRDLLEEGKSTAEISNELGIEENTVRKQSLFLKELASEEVSLEIVAKKRSEIYTELMWASDEAKKMFEFYSEKKEGVNAKRFFDAFLQSLIERAKLYGIYHNAESSVTINQQFNSFVPDKIDSDVAENISKLVKNNFEKKVKDRYVEISANQDMPSAD